MDYSLGDHSFPETFGLFMSTTNSGLQSGDGVHSESARDTLIQAFSAALLVPITSDLESAEYRRIPQWDSVAHMRLVAEIEMAFDIMLDTDDVVGMSSFRKAAE